MGPQKMIWRNDFGRVTPPKKIISEGREWWMKQGISCSLRFPRTTSLSLTQWIESLSSTRNPVLFGIEALPESRLRIRNWPPNPRSETLLLRLGRFASWWIFAGDWRVRKCIQMFETDKLTKCVKNILWPFFWTKRQSDKAPAGQRSVENSPTVFEGRTPAGMGLLCHPQSDWGVLTLNINPSYQCLPLHQALTFTRFLHFSLAQFEIWT